MGGGNTGRREKPAQGRQRFHHGKADRLLVPGVTGFLVTTTTGPIDRAKRELEALWTRHVDDEAVLRRMPGGPPQWKTDAEATVSATNPQACEGSVDEDGEGEIGHSGVAGADKGGSPSIAAMLMSELDAVRDSEGGRKRPRDDVDGHSGADKTHQQKRGLGRGMHWRIRDTHCKGYLFYEVDSPPPIVGDVAEEKPEGDVAAVAAPDSASGPPADEHQAALRLFKPNPNVKLIADSLVDDLLANPQLVARFSYKLLPVVASCNPSLPFIVPLVKTAVAEIPVPAGRSAIKTCVSMFVRNNTTVDREKKKIREGVEAALPMNRFFLVNPSSADVHIILAVIHSTCCVAIQTDVSRRMEYNLHRLSEPALQLDQLTKASGKESAQGVIPAADSGDCGQSGES